MLIVIIKLLLTNTLDLRFLIFRQPLPNAIIYLDDAKGLSVPHHMHFFETSEGLHKDMTFNLLVGYAIAAVDAVVFSMISP